MNPNAIENVRAIVQRSFKDKYPDCISCSPIKWTPFWYQNRMPENKLLQLTKTYIGDDLSFSTFIYKMEPISDSLHYTFFAQFGAVHSEEDRNKSFRHTFQLRIHFYNNPTIRVFAPEISDCLGIVAPEMELGQTVALIVVSASQFLEHMLKLYGVDNHVAQFHVMEATSELISMLIDSLEGADPKHYNYKLSYYSMQDLRILAVRSEYGYKMAMEMMKGIAQNTDICYRVCMAFFDELPDTLASRYSKPITHRGNQKKAYHITREHVEKARQAYIVNRKAAQA